jgi:urease accessory protein
MRADTTEAQPRAVGEARLSVKLSGGQTRIGTLRHGGASKLVFPRVEGPLQAMLVNTAGGITGGDRFSLSADAGPGTDICLTTQAAERVYRAQPGQTGRMQTTLSVLEGARLAWLPQETILYDRADFARSLQVDLAPDAKFLMVEPLVFGRTAMGEEVRALRFDDRIEVRRAGKPIFLDGMRWRGDAATQLDRPAIGDGARAFASMLYVAPDAAAHLDPLRRALAPVGAASLLAEDILVARLAASDSFTLRQCLLPALDRLTRQTLPVSWRL